jgi:hypothetical protein
MSIRHNCGNGRFYLVGTLWFRSLLPHFPQVVGELNGSLLSAQDVPEFVLKQFYNNIINAVFDLNLQGTTDKKIEYNYLLCFLQIGSDTNKNWVKDTSKYETFLSILCILNNVSYKCQNLNLSRSHSLHPSQSFV